MHISIFNEIEVRKSVIFLVSAKDPALGESPTNGQSPSNSNDHTIL